VGAPGEDVSDPFFGGVGDVGFDWVTVFVFELFAEDGIGEAGAVASAAHEGDVAGWVVSWGRVIELEVIRGHVISLIANVGILEGVAKSNEISCRSFI